MKLQHLVIVRINVRMPGGWKRPSGKDGVGTSEWVENRMELFRKYCYPSLVNQRCQDFELLALFDDETTDRELLKGLPRMTPIFFKPEPAWKHQVYTLIRGRVKPGTQWLLTTRIDSDDAYHEGYIKAMQRIAKESQVDRVIYCPTGYVYKVGAKRLRRTSRTGWYTCFLTRLESTKNKVFGCYAPGMHGWRGLDADEVESFSVLHDRAIWVQIIHGENICTAHGGRGTKDANLTELKAFGVKV